MLGVVKKTILADTLARGADMISPPSGHDRVRRGMVGCLFFTFQIYFDFSAYSDMAIGLARMLGFRLLENFNMPYLVVQHHRVLAALAHLAVHLDPRVPVRPARRQPRAARAALPQPVDLLPRRGLWHGAAWTYIAWGAYNGLFLVLEKLFLLRWLNRLPRLAANA